MGSDHHLPIQIHCRTILSTPQGHLQHHSWQPPNSHSYSLSNRPSQLDSICPLHCVMHRIYIYKFFSCGSFFSATGCVAWSQNFFHYLSSSVFLSAVMAAVRAQVSLYHRRKLGNCFSHLQSSKPTLINERTDVSRLCGS